MAARDIMPYDGPHGGHVRVQHFAGDFVTDTQTFELGEPVRVDTSGALVESGDSPLATVGSLIGIAAAGPGAAQANVNPETGAAFADGDRCPVYLIDPTTTWATPNFSSAGAAFADALPTQGEIGQEVELTVIGGVWGVSITVAANANIGRILDVLDAQGRSIQQPTTPALAAGDTYTIVFTLTGALQPSDELGDAQA